MSRFLVRGDLRPGAALVPLANVPELQYENQYGYNPLADKAADRGMTITLLVNFYKIVADFYHTETMAGFNLDALSEGLQRQISEAMFNRILYGYGVMAPILGGVQNVSARFWWPLRENSRNIGAVLVIPFSTVSFSGTAMANGIPNRCLATEHINGTPSALYLADYNGITIGNQWRQLGSVDRVVVFGDGTSDFTQIGALAQSIDQLLRGANTLLDRHSQPHLQVPAAAVRYNANNEPYLEIDKEGMIFPVTADDRDVKYVSPAGAPDLWMNTLTTQLRLLAAMTAIPPQVLNEFPLPRLESAESLAQLTAASVKRVRNLRNELAGAMRNIGLEVPRIEPPGATEGNTENGSDTT